MLELRAQLSPQDKVVYDSKYNEMLYNVVMELNANLVHTSLPI
jgi:hypothetical protein